MSFHLSWPLPGQSSGMLVPWILSAVDVSPGGCFQARSILNAFAKTWGAPWLSESGWDTAHSISCWPVSTSTGQPGLQPASTWICLQTQQGQWSQGLDKRTFLEDQPMGRNSANRGAVLVITADSQVHCCAMVFLQRSTHLCCSILVTGYQGLGTPYIALKPTLSLKYLLWLPVTYKIGNTP